MKKIFIAAFMLLGISAAGFAQTTPAAKATKAPAKKVMTTPVVTKTGGTVAARPVATVTPAAGSAKSTTAVKHDMKKMNPATAKTAAPVKKDGSPDKRFSANKHLKKNGSPDKRYKEHKKS